MNRIATAALGAAVVIGSGISAPPAQAAYMVTLKEVRDPSVDRGFDVVATGSGSIDTTGLTFESNTTFDVAIQPNDGYIGTGLVPPPGGALYFGTITGPTSFGSGGKTVAGSGSGDVVAIIPTEGNVELPENYTSGNPLSDTAIYHNESIRDLGATPGTYVWSWGPSAEDDTFTLVVPAAVPEPSTVVQFGVGLGGLVLAGLWRRRRQADRLFIT